MEVYTLLLHGRPLCPVVQSRSLSAIESLNEHWLRRGGCTYLLSVQ